MIKRLHPLAGALAMATILTFWLSSAFSELFASLETVASVKRAILWAMPVLILSLMLTGASGFRLAPIKAKLFRMKIVAANGLLVLLPSAVFLDRLAASGHFDALFYSVQGLELAGGGVNLALMALNVRDGLALKGRRYIRP